MIFRKTDPRWLGTGPPPWRQEADAIGASVRKLLKRLTVLALVLWVGWRLLEGISPTTAYALRYGVDNDQVTVFPRPHDCDFMKAPIGSKFCHFDPVVTVTGEGKRDRRVLVEWQRVEN